MTQTTQTQSDINRMAWKACDTFRGSIDPAQYKDYILTTIFLKYISDVWHDHYDAFQAQYGNNPDQLRLAHECDELATSLHNVANERRTLVRTLEAHVITWRQWVTNLNARAAAEDAAANRLQSAGNL